MFLEENQKRSNCKFKFGKTLPGDTELKILDNKSETSFRSPTREYSQTKTMLFQSSEKNRNLVNLLIKKKLAKSERLNRLETECCENLRNFCLDFIDKNFRKPTFNGDYLELIPPPLKFKNIEGKQSNETRQIATNSNVLIPLSLQPNVVDLRYF